MLWGPSTPCHLPSPSGKRAFPIQKCFLLLLRCNDGLVLAQPHPVGSPGDPRRPELLSRAELNPVVKNYTCLEIWDHSLLWEPPSPSTHLWEKLFQEALASSPDEEAGKETRTKAIRRKENYTFLICKRTAPEAL